MRLNTTKKLSALVFLAASLGMTHAWASLETFDVKWSGANYGNQATAIGSITLDNSLLPQTGNTGYVSLPSPEITALSITVSGASSGDGSFSLADFAGVSFTTPSPLNLNTQLIGQSLSTGVTFGALESDGSAGDFNLFAVTSSAAPYGKSNFTLVTDNGAGDKLSVTFIEEAPPIFSPLPPAWVLMLGGGALMLRKRGKLETARILK